MSLVASMQIRFTSRARMKAKAQRAAMRTKTIKMEMKRSAKKKMIMNSEIYE